MGADPTATVGEDAVRVVAVVRLRLLVATAVVVVEKETLAAAVVVVVAVVVVADVRWGDDSFGLAAAVATKDAILFRRTGMDKVAVAFSEDSSLE